MNKSRTRKKAGHRSWAARNAPVAGEHRGDIMSADTRSQVMSRIKGKDTSPERTICSKLQKHGVYFAKHVKDLPGRPDIVFRRARLVVFIDGDFWHGWRFPLWKHKLSQKWREKIATTRERDRRNFGKLRRMGWKVIRIWEHEIENHPEQCIVRILAVRDAQLAKLVEQKGSTKSMSENA
jgi:DNA mismatch endonuclease (patch repair protein)